MLVKHYPTLLRGVESVGYWNVQVNPTPSNTIQQCWILIPSTKLRCIFNNTKDNVGQSWVKSSNIIQHCPTLSNKFDDDDEMGQTCCVQQCLIMFDPHVWSIWTGLYYHLTFMSCYNLFPTPWKNLLIHCSGLHGPLVLHHHGRPSQYSPST